MGAVLLLTLLAAATAVPALAANPQQVPTLDRMTPEQLVVIAGAVLSLICAYFPGVRTKYDTLDGEHKAAVMGVLLLLVTLGILAASCFEIIHVGVNCTKAGIVDLVWTFLLAAMANQTTFTIAVEPFKKKGQVTVGL